MVHGLAHPGHDGIRGGLNPRIHRAAQLMWRVEGQTASEQRKASRNLSEFFDLVLTYATGAKQAAH